MFDVWDDRIAAATDSNSQRSLLAELALYRAQRLSDVSASRQATFGLSKLHKLVGDHAAAVREAKSLLSLCQTPPEARKPEVDQVLHWLDALGEKVKRPSSRKVAARGERTRQPKEKSKKPQEKREEGRSPSVQKATDAYLSGDFKTARQVLKGKRGVGVEPLKVLISLGQGLASDDEGLRQAVRREETRLRKSLGLPAAPKPVVPPTTDLGRFIGRAIPNKRLSRVRTLARFADDNADKLDELAVKAIEHHLSEVEDDSPAPWLAGLVARAMVAGGPQLTAMLQEHQGKPWADLFADQTFLAQVEVARAGLGKGLRFGGLRQGVLPKSEPADRQLWTLRLRGKADAVIAMSPQTESPWDEEAAAAVAARLAKLAEKVILVAEGAGHATLRTASSVLGCEVKDATADLIADLEPGPPPAKRQASGGQGTQAPAGDAVTKEPTKKEPKGPPPPEVLTAALPNLSMEQAVEILGTFRRPWTALKIAAREDVSDEAASVLLHGLDAVLAPGHEVPEAWAFAIEVGGPKVAKAVQTIDRYRRPGINRVFELGAAAKKAGFSTGRVLLGVTKREAESNPALATLAPHLAGFWRLLVRSAVDASGNERRGEIWFVSDLPPEGRAAIPQLLLQDFQRVVCLPIEPELLAWYGNLDGPEALGWTGEEQDELSAALLGWELSAMRKRRS